MAFIMRRTRPERFVQMGLSITHLGSGSKGNSTLIASERAKILIDQGFSGRQLELRLKEINIHPSEIDAIIISHHHGDHSSGAAIAHKRWGVPLFANFQTAAALGYDLIHQVTIFENLERMEFSDLSVLPIPVPHDKAHNVGFIISHHGSTERAAIFSDLGSWTDEIISHIAGCSHISIEANYDEKLLWNGPYSPRLKERISGRGGHLSNKQTGLFLKEVVSKYTKSIVLTHLSEKNNRPYLAESTVLFHIGELFEGDIAVTSQSGPQFSHYIGANEEKAKVIEIL